MSLPPVTAGQLKRRVRELAAIAELCGQERARFQDQARALEAENRTLREQVETLTRERDELAIHYDERKVAAVTLAHQAEEYKTRAEAAERETEHMRQLMAEEFKGITAIRCGEHRGVPRINTNEAEGGECGACIHEDGERALRVYVDEANEHVAAANQRLGDVGARAEAAEAALAELVRWRQGMTRVTGGVIRHEGWAEFEDSWWSHLRGEPCILVYPDGTTECDWLAAHPLPERE